MSGIEIDTSEVRALAAEMAGSSARVFALSRKAVEKSALNIKNGLASDMQGHPSFAGFPASISYDMSGLSAEIGPELGGAGSLGGVVYEGTARTGPIADLLAPVRAEAPQLEFYLADAAVKAVFGK